MDELIIVFILIAISAVLLGVGVWVLDMTHRWGAKSEAKLWKEHKKKLLSENKEEN